MSTGDSGSETSLEALTLVAADGTTIDLGALLVAAAGDDVIETSPDHLDEIHPSRGRVARLTNRTNRNEVRVADGSDWHPIGEYAISNAASEVTVQDHDDQIATLEGIVEDLQATTDDHESRISSLEGA